MEAQEDERRRKTRMKIIAAAVVLGVVVWAMFTYL